MNTIKKIQYKIAGDNTTFALKVAIIGIALIIVCLALSTNNKIVLAGLLMYEVLP